MQGMVFDGDCMARLATFPDPAPGPGEVVVEIKASCMCGSDLHMYRRPPSESAPHPIRGHEPCGIVAAVGPGALTPHARIGGAFKLVLSEVLRKQLRVLTSWTMSTQAQRACADFIIERGIDVDNIFTHRWRLDQAEEAYRVFNRQSSGKGVFLM